MDTAAEVERTRRALEVAEAMTLRRKGCLRQMQREIAAAESAEREAAAAAATAQHALDCDTGTATAGATAGLSPLTRQQGVGSRSERPGDDAFLKGNVACMASCPKQEFSELAASVVETASAILSSVRKASLH